MAGIFFFLLDLPVWTLKQVNQSSIDDAMRRDVFWDRGVIIVLSSPLSTGGCSGAGCSEVRKVTATGYWCGVTWRMTWAGAWWPQHWPRLGLATLLARSHDHARMLHLAIITVRRDWLAEILNWPLQRPAVTILPPANSVIAHSSIMTSLDSVMFGRIRAIWTSTQYLRAIHSDAPSRSYQCEITLCDCAWAGVIRLTLYCGVDCCAWRRTCAAFEYRWRAERTRKTGVAWVQYRNTGLCDVILRVIQVCTDVLLVGLWLLS